MIADALDGKIDLIITKSVSRFASNTLDSKGELLITIMSSLAQEEIRSISENVTWGQRKRFADGKVTLPYKRFLGDEKGEDGLPKIVEEEATVVRLIYKLFLEGKTSLWIAKHLTSNKIPTPGGKENWQQSTVLSILQNEKYKGDAILQKSFTIGFLSKKKKINEGEVPQYYVENSHPVIITPEVFDLVQHELLKWKSVKGYKTGGGCFSGEIVCSECGSFYGSKVWHSTSKYCRTIWQCNHKFKNDKKCLTPHLYEETLKESFLEVFNSLINNKDEIINSYEAIIQALTDTTKLDKESARLQSEREVVTELLQKCVEENAYNALDQAEYQDPYNMLVERYDTVKNGFMEIENKQLDQNAKRESIRGFIRAFEQSDTLLTEFDESLWNATVEAVTVHSEHDITFEFRDGMKIEWKM